MYAEISGKSKSQLIKKYIFFIINDLGSAWLDPSLPPPGSEKEHIVYNYTILKSEYIYNIQYSIHGDSPCVDTGQCTVL